MQLIVMFLRKSKGNDLRRNICQKRLSERLDTNQCIGNHVDWIGIYIIHNTIQAS